jgi:hypothetical protein
MHNKKILDSLVKQFENIELTDTLEIIANLLIAKGSDYLPIPAIDEEDSLLKAADLLTFIVDYRKRNGDSLPISTVYQGLTILLWLEKNNGKKIS